MARPKKVENQTLPVCIDDLTQLQARETFNKHEQEIYQKVVSIISKRVTDDIWAYWEIGKEVEKAYTPANEKKQIYGKKFLERLSCSLGYKSERTLRNAMAVVQTFGTKQAFMEYVRMRGEADTLLHWSHMVHLANIQDDASRRELAAAALANGWTAEELFQRIKSLCDRKPRGTRVAATKIPSSVRECFTHIYTQTTKFIDNCDKSWGNPDSFDLLSQIDDIPADKLDGKLVESVHETHQQVLSLRQRVVQLGQQLSLAEDRIKERIKAQDAIDEAAEYEEDEEASEEFVDDADDVDDADETDDAAWEEADSGEWEEEFDDESSDSDEEDDTDEVEEFEDVELDEDEYIDPESGDKYLDCGAAIKRRKQAEQEKIDRRKRKTAAK